MERRFFIVLAPEICDILDILYPSLDIDGCEGSQLLNSSWFPKTLSFSFWHVLIRNISILISVLGHYIKYFISKEQTKDVISRIGNIERQFGLAIFKGGFIKLATGGQKPLDVCL